MLQFSQQLQHFCRRLLFLLENGSFFSSFCSVVRQPYDAGTDTYPRLCNPILFCRIDVREDANTHKAISCKYLSKKICTVVGEWHHGYFCLGYVSSSCYGWPKRCGGIRVRFLLCTILGVVTETTSDSLRTGLVLSAGNRYLFLLRRLIPFRFLTTAPVPIFPCLASSNFDNVPSCVEFLNIVIMNSNRE